MGIAHNRQYTPFSKIVLFWLGLIAFCLGSTSGARAGAVSVCASGCDFTTIRAAIESASVPAGSLIQVLDGVHTEGGVLVDKDVTIEGLGPQATIVQAHAQPEQATERVFFIAPGATVNIRGMTIRHGNPTSEPESGGGIRNEGTLTLESVIVCDNSGSAGGGILNDGTITLTNCTVRDNVSRGGAVHYIECKTGGGLKNLSGQMTLINSTVQNNHAEAKGGGIHVACKGTLTLINSTISRNQTARSGGGVFLNGVGQFTNSTISQNQARTGGGVAMEGSGEQGVVYGQLNYTHTLITGNVATMEKYGVADCLIGDYGSIATNEGNWVGDNQCEAAYSGDPMLADLSDVSPPDTNSTSTHIAQAHALLPDSPAVDLIPPEACKIEDDQWGTARPQGEGCDIGAYELPQERGSAPSAAISLVLSAFLLMLVGGMGWLFSRARR
jgi:hypothetical protein